MFKATHTKTAPWFVVNFNNQREGRIRLIRHLLDQVPDTRIPPLTIDLPPLENAPAKERHRVIKPI